MCKLADRVAEWGRIADAAGSELGSTWAMRGEGAFDSCCRESGTGPPVGRAAAEAGHGADGGTRMGLGARVEFPKDRPSRG